MGRQGLLGSHGLYLGPSRNVGLSHLYTWMFNIVQYFFMCTTYDPISPIPLSLAHNTVRNYIRHLFNSFILCERRN